MADRVIEAKEIVKTYGSGDTSFDAIKGISLNINQGEFVAIMGPSGSGKSTLMNIIGCLDQATSGNYVLDNKVIGTLSDDKLATIRNEKIGFVFQQFNLLPRTTTLENVMLPYSYANNIKKNKQDYAVKVLESVGLIKYLNKRPNELSGGEQQRVAIARAMVNDPSIILADEPTGALDTKTGQEILEIFNTLNSEGKTIILITHEKEIAFHANRIIFLRDGEIESDKNHNKKEKT